MSNRKAIHRRAAHRHIRKSPGKATVMFKNATVENIVQAILYADKQSQPFTDQYAPMLRVSTDMGTLTNVWAFVRDNIRYVQDDWGEEIIKSPGRTWQDQEGDCKSMSVMVGSLAQNLGYSYFYRVAFYDPDRPNAGHIYPVVVLNNGTQVIVDPVNDRFNHEYRYWKKQDYQPDHKFAAALNGRPPAPVEANTPSLVNGLLIGAAAYAAAYVVFKILT